jgi:MerR family transcriptional regulator, heat shock protein HspR
MTLADKRDNDDVQPLFTIGVVAEMIGVTPATLRIWEKKRLVSPSRRGKNRCYSYRDLERLKEIRHLLGERKMNIVGARAVLDRQRCWELKRCGARKETCPVYTREQIAREG